MHVGVLQFELIVPGSRSLKDKRRVVRSVKDRLHRQHLVSVAEVGTLDHHQTATMALALVSSSAPYISSVFDRILEKLRALPNATLGDVQRDILHAAALPTADTADDGRPLWTPDERRDDPQENAA